MTQQPPVVPERIWLDAVDCSEEHSNGVYYTDRPSIANIEYARVHPVDEARVEEASFTLDEIKQGYEEFYRNVECLTCARLLAYVKDLLSLLPHHSSSEQFRYEAEIRNRLSTATKLLREIQFALCQVPLHFRSDVTKPVVEEYQRLAQRLLGFLGEVAKPLTEHISSSEPTSRLKDGGAEEVERKAEELADEFINSFKKQGLDSRFLHYLKDRMHGRINAEFATATESSERCPECDAELVSGIRSIVQPEIGRA